MNNTCGCQGKCANPHTGLFVLRVITGLVFIMHGWMKFQNMDGTRMFFASLHLWPWLGTAIAVLELLGGIALVLGVFTCFFAPLLMIDMAVAIILVTWPHGGWSGSEKELLLLAAAAAIKASGAGRWKIRGSCGCMWCRGKGGAACNTCGHDQGQSGCDCACHKK